MLKATKVREIALETAHVCDRCGTTSSPVDVRFGGYLPQGWSHLTYVIPATQNGEITGPLDDDLEYHFCYTCSTEILHHV